MKAFGSYHPTVLLTYFLSVLLIVMFVTNPVLELLALSGGICFCLVLLRKRSIAGDIGFYLMMFLLVAITNPLFSHNGVTPLFFLNGNPVTLEAFAYGIALAVMIVGVVIWCKCYSEIMTSDKFLYLFGRIIPKLSLSLSMALRFIPMFKRQLHKVSKAQKAMGLYSSKSYMDKIRSAMRVFMAMIAWSLENAMETASSMKARGYGLKGRTNFSLFRFTKRDGILIFTILALLGTLLYGIANRQMTFYYYPRISELNVSLSAVIIYAAFFVLSFLPFLIEVWEIFIWNYYRSKI